MAVIKSITIKNVLWSPLSIEIGEGKTITLQPRGTGTITEKQFKSVGCQKYLRDESIIIVPQRY